MLNLYYICEIIVRRYLLIIVHKIVIVYKILTNIVYSFRKEKEN